MLEETLLEEFSKRGVFLERGIDIKYAPEYSLFFAESGNGDVSYMTADGDNEVILNIFNGHVEGIRVNGPAAKYIKEIYSQIENSSFSGGEDLGPCF